MMKLISLFRGLVEPASKNLMQFQLVPITFYFQNAGKVDQFYILRMFRQMKRFPILNRIRFNSSQSTSGPTEPTFSQLYFNYMKSNRLF